MNDEYKRAVAIGSRMELMDVVLAGARVKMHVDRGAALESMPWEFSIQTRAGWSMDDDGHYSAVVELRALLFAAVDEENGNDDAEPIITIQPRFALEYQYDGQVDAAHQDEESLRAFAQVNAMYNVWPYFREFVQSTMGRMGLPPHVVPTFRVDGAAQATLEERED